MDTLTPLSQEELQAFIRLIAFFDWQISSIPDRQSRKDFLERHHLSALITSYLEHEELIFSNDLGQLLQEECYQEMNLVRLRIIANTSLIFVPYIYQTYQPDELTPEMRQALESSLEALDWFSVALQNQADEHISNATDQLDTARTTKQMVNNLSVRYDEYHNQGKGENTNFARILYSPDESYTRLHETHILTRSFQMYCSEGLNPLDLLIKGHHILLLKSVLYKEVLKPDLSGLTAPVPDYLLLMAQTIYLHMVREYLNKRVTNSSLVQQISDNLEELGFDTYELDVLGENFSDEYIRYYQQVSSGNKLLSDVPIRFIDSVISQAAVQHSIANFPFVPLEQQTPALCRDAISYKPAFLQYVAPSLCNYSLCVLAVSQDGLALQYVPDSLREQVWDEALFNNGLAIRYIPIAQVTREIALLAVSTNSEAYFFLPPVFQTKEVLILAMRRNPFIYKRLSKTNREIVDVALLALSADPQAAAFLPETLAANPDFLQLASSISNGWYQYIIQEYRTEYGKQLFCGTL